MTIEDIAAEITEKILDSPNRKSWNPLILEGLKFAIAQETERRNAITLPQVTQQAIIHLDATPDWEYPLRILRAYRENCNVRWIPSMGTETKHDPNPVFALMNEAQEKRAHILDEAINVLEKWHKGERNDGERKRNTS